MYILGFCAYVFDSSACLIKDGQLVAACQEERFTREKNTGAFPKNAIAFCLEEAKITIEDIDHVAFYWCPFRGLKDRFIQIFRELPRSLMFWNSHSDKWLSMVFAEKELKKNFPGEHRFCFHNVRHHLAHASSTFLVSPDKEANLLVMDGSGEIECTSLAFGNDLTLSLDKQQKFPHSLGYLYVSLTHYLGFKPDCDEYKVMAMASMGEDGPFYEKFKSIIKLTADGLYDFDLSYFNYPKGIRDPWVSDKFIKEFGPVRERNEGGPLNSAPLEKRHYDIAWALQKRLEDVAIHMANALHSKRPCKNLQLSGGVALNCVMNEILTKETPYDNVTTISAPHDAGTSLGSAFYVYHCILKNPRGFIYQRADWGPSFSDETIKKTLESHGTRFKFQYLNEEELIKKATQELLEQKIIGWFQGRTEFGPRALGHRSILADPRNHDMKDKINAKIKHRESFRPFAPAILSERVSEYFEVNEKRFLPFMSHVVQAKPKKVKEMAAVVHFDGTSRVQMVSKEVQPLFYNLINSFAEQSGVPILLNTSFNDNGEPIVNTPVDALSSFERTNLDGLFIGHYYVTKQQEV